MIDSTIRSSPLFAICSSVSTEQLSLHYTFFPRSEAPHFILADNVLCKPVHNRREVLAVTLAQNVESSTQKNIKIFKKIPKEQEQVTNNLKDIHVSAKIFENSTYSC